MERHRNELHRRAVPGTARFLTFSTYHRLPLFGNDRIKDRFVESLTIALATHDAALLAWVVMPEHVHLIVYFEGDDRIPQLLRTLKRPFARLVLDRWRQLDAPVLERLRDLKGEVHFWQPGGGFDRNVVGRELIEKIRYIHKNPITRGLCTESDAWAWSSARAYRQRVDAIGPPLALHLVPNHRGSMV